MFFDIVNDIVLVATVLLIALPVTAGIIGHFENPNGCKSVFC